MSQLVVCPTHKIILPNTPIAILSPQNADWPTSLICIAALFYIACFRTLRRFHIAPASSKAARSAIIAVSHYFDLGESEYRDPF